MAEEQDLIALQHSINRQEKQEHKEITQVNEAETGVTFFHDLIAGGIAGTASVFVGHPFDTIKVRLQAATKDLATQKRSISSTVKGNLFKGMGAPLFAAAGVNAMVFSSYAGTSRFLDLYFPVTTRNHDGDNESLDSRSRSDINSTFWRNFVCGSVAGLLQAVIICPTEHIKCRLQVDAAATMGKSTSTSTSTKNNGPISMARYIYKHHGIRGLFCGWSATCIREVPTFGLYFAVYDGVRQSIVEWYDNDNSAEDKNNGNESSAWKASALAGGISGSLTWALCYPVDVMKTRIQTSALDTPSSHPSRKMMPVAKHLYETVGIRGMFRGLGVTIVRAFPVNGIIFPVYEYSLEQLCGK